ncbi:MAG: hypothetical protein ABIR33_00990 [Pyrinomonadaceae bacterium]
MKFSKEIWAEKRKRGIGRYLLIDGILMIGGPFAVVMQIVGVFVFRDEGQSIGQYFTSTKTWFTFLLHGLLFGGIMGLLNWYRSEVAFRATESGEGI